MPLDPTRVSSGFDIEIGLGAHYLQSLLLLALDMGQIRASFPVKATFRPELGDFLARFIVPADIDRTYELRADADLPIARSDAGFDVAVLFDDPLGADLRVSCKVRLTREADHIDQEGVFTVFARLSLQKTPSASGRGLDSVGLGIEVVRAEGVDLADAKEAIDQVLTLDSLASGGRIEDIALRKFRPEDDIPASLTLYVNLLLRNGPQPADLTPARGDVTQGRNILPPEADLVFATRKDIYGALAVDTFFRQVDPKGKGTAFPLRVGGQDARLLSISVAPTKPDEGPNRLRLIFKVAFDVATEPEVTLLVDLFGDVDADGVMVWRALTEVHESSVLTQVLFAIAAGFAALAGPEWALLLLLDLEIGKHAAEEAANLLFVQNRADKRLDATLLDISPNRLTIFRRRWDPLYSTHHQVGLRAGATRIDADGIAFWGRAVLTRAVVPVAGAVIREAVQDGEAAPSALRYRTEDLAADDFHFLTDVVPATDRRPFAQVDVPNEGPLFELTLTEARERLAARRLVGPVPCLVERVDLREGQIHRLLLISQRESAEQRNLLIAAHENLVAPIILSREPQVRTAVLQAFADRGVIPTQQDVDAAVSAELQALLDEAKKAYAEGDLAEDLEAAIEPLLRLELAPNDAGQLQEDGLLTIPAFDRVFIAARKTYYYRDHFFADIETTKDKRIADNLASKPRYHSTPQGPVLVR